MPLKVNVQWQSLIREVEVTCVKDENQNAASLEVVQRAPIIEGVKRGLYCNAHFL